MTNKLPVFAAALLLFCLQNCKSKDNDVIIVTDDVLMLNRVAVGLESTACANFPSNRSFGLPAANTQTVNWTEAKSLPNDTLKIIRLEVLSDTGSVAKFTMTLRPLSGKPSEIQCMKGFGCTTPWVNFPWIAPGENFLDQTVFKFRVKPVGSTRFTVENYNTDKALTVRVNPPI
jgi:hypothetical protein